MKLAGLMLANHAVMNNGLVNVEGGGWRFMPASVFPWAVQGFVVGVVELDVDSLGSREVLHLSIENAAGQSEGTLGSIVVDATSTDAMPLRTAFSIPFAFVVSEPGHVTFRLSTPTESLGSIALPITEAS